MATDVDVTPLLRQPLYERTPAMDVESPPPSPELCTQPVPRALAGVIVYVEVRSIDSRENRSSAIASELETLGATVSTRFTKDVTHVVFKDGKASAKERAERSRVYLVSPLWVEACKRANDWISEAKYPVITRDSSETAGPTGGGTPVVLGKIKRVKSMQPKPLEEEIAKSLERSRKRPHAGRVAGREGEKRQREALDDEDRPPFQDMDTEEDSSAGLDLPVINLPPTPRLPLSEKPSNTVTPFVTVNNVNKKQTNTNKQCEQQGEQENKQTSVTTEDDDFQNNLSSKVVAKGNQTKSAGSKAVVKSTKGTKSKKQSARSKGAVKVMKCTVVAGQRGKAGSRSSKKALVKNAMAAKKAKKVTSVKAAANTETENKTESVEEKIVSPNSMSKKKRRTTSGRLFCRELPTLVLTSVDTGDQDVVMSVVKKLGRFNLSSMVDDLTTHVVCGRVRRTINILTATVRGCWILSLDWVWKSLEAGRWLPAEPFEMADSFPAAQFFRLERAEAGLLFRPSFFKKAGSVFVSPSSSPPAAQLELLLASGGASVTRSLRKADVCVGCHSPREGLEEEEEVVSVTENWILDSISAHQFLSYDSYILDRPESRATSPEL